MFRWRKRSLSQAAVVCSLLLGGAPGPVLAQTNPGQFSFDPDASAIHWRVYKAGTFARLGHNHVVSVPRPSGMVHLAESLADSRVEIRIPVADLVIDDPKLRERYGEDFASKPNADDIAGTRRNMLTPDLLNGEQFPELSIVGTRATGAGPDQTIDLDIGLLGRHVELTVPVEIELGADAITARAEFRLTHEQLGLTPFSVMLGALQVAQEIDFTLSIRAVRDAP